jgi:hypothetical protein
MVEIPVETVDALIAALVQYGENAAGGVLLPDELESGAYYGGISEDVRTVSLKISFE